MERSNYRKTSRISVSFDTETYTRLNEIAERDDLPIAWIVRRAVKELLENGANHNHHNGAINGVSEGS